MPRRKAITEESTPVPTRRMKSPAFMLSLLGLGVLVVGGAIMLGRSDNGQIDVAAAVREAGVQTDASGNQIAPVNVPGQEFRNMPNGGLVPQGDQSSTPAPIPEPEPAATTTDDGATTTPETTEEASEEGVEESESDQTEV